MRFFLTIFILVVASVSGGASAGREACALPAAIDFEKASDNLPTAQRQLLDELHAHPTCALLWFDLGNIFYLRSDFKHASRAYRKVVELGGELSETANFYLAKSRRRQGEKLEAVLALSEIETSRLPASLQEELAEEKKSALDETLDDALADLKAGRNSDAERKLIAALNLRSNAYVYAALAVALHKQGRWEREQTTLDYARELQLTNDETRLFHELKKRLNGVDRFAAERVWHGDLDLAVGFDSNVTRSAQERTRSEVTRAVADAKRIFYVNETYRSSITVGFTLDDYAKLPSERYMTAFAMNQNAWALGDFTFTVAPEVSYELYGDRPYWFRPGVYTALDFTQDQFHAGLSYEAWRNKDISSTFEQIDGSSQTLAANVANAFSKLVVRAGFSYSDFEIGDDVTSTYRIPQAYTGHGPSFGLSYAATDRFTLETSVDWQQRSFKRDILPSGLKREDRVVSALVRARYRFSDRLSGYAQINDLRRLSTMDASSPLDENISATTGLLGVTWQPF